MIDLVQELSRSLSTQPAPEDRVLFRELSYEVVGAAMEVHRHIGPGMTESVYQRSLEKELARRGIPFRAQVSVPLFFKGDRVGEYFADLIVDDKIVLELKSVTKIERVHTAQLLAYLHATKCRLGMLINFNVPMLKQGVRRMVL